MRRNIFQRGKLFTILLFCFLLVGCSIDNFGEKITDLDSKIGEEIEKLESREVLKDTDGENEPDDVDEKESDKVDIDVTDDIKKQVEQWIEGNDLNRYGDMVGTIYAGGTPLFNEVTSKAIDRYDYIINSHPELKDILNK